MHNDGVSNSASTTISSQKSRSIFSIPEPVKNLFDKFPLIVYPPNELPARAPSSRDENTLYVFAVEGSVNAKKSSFNPSCLKWQTFLLFTDIKFRIRPSNNHASPTGSLPFLIPAQTVAQTAISELAHPIPANKLPDWAYEQGKNIREPTTSKFEVYSTLISNQIRSAWLYFLYLEPANFVTVAQRLYVEPISSSGFVRATTAFQLRRAAENELRKSMPVINVSGLYEQADIAFQALSVLLGSNTFFFGEKQPTMFDANIFAYTHLLLDKEMQWQEERLVIILKKYTSLVDHRDRIYKSYFL
ncbi:MAG: hypothetical protein M1834_006830 [Cirrosporium novae-zelandiae]|nr:MAG: hypothetical protein M1834_006830 [Cirrosporium novae-zelandiae]